jgi:Ca2+-binding EF-hand superfamily protein
VVEDGVHIMGPLLRDRISEIFKQIDVDHDAAVDQRELIEGFGLVGIQLTPEEADRIMKVCREQKRDE